MAEQKRPVQPVRVVYICDSCGIGEMRASTVAYLPHTCTHCSATKALGVSYPYIDYIDAVDVANDLARKELFAPPTSGTLEFQYTQVGIGAPTSMPVDVSGEPTFAERHAANDAALAEIRAFVYGDGNE